MTTREQRARAQERKVRAGYNMARAQVLTIAAIVTHPDAPAVIAAVNTAVREHIDRANSAQRLTDPPMGR